jgi:NlpC/P60 family
VASDDSARLLERLLEDPAFRARFRQDPAGAARAAGFGALAEELKGGERPFQTLEIRESRSSAAGVMLAAAVEGLGLFELSEHVLPHLGAEDAMAADQPPQAGQSAPSVDPDDLTAVEPDDAGESDDSAASDDFGDANESDDSDTAPDSGDSDASGSSDDTGESDDSGESDDADDEDEEDEDDDEDDDEPDEEEPDEVGPDADDLSDDETVGDDSGQSGDSSDSSDSDDSSDSSDSDDSSDSSDSDDSSDSGGGDGGTDGSAPDDDEDIQVAPVPDGYPGDEASQAKIGAWMASEAQKRELPPELPVMAALVESGMQNLPGGDADSAGFFQMRVSIWNTGDYAGYTERPEKQLDWFLDHAEEVKAQRVARGLPTDPDHYGEWIADVERPAAQYRGRYQLQLDDARHLLKRAFPDGDGLDDLPDADAGGSSTPRAGPRAREALAEARKYLGTPYQWGGESPQTGFDCSGLVQWAYAKAGIQIPRVTDQQILAPGAIKVGRNHLLPGDLVFFRDASGYVHHVGMSLGGDRFIEAPRTGLNVRISSLKDPYYAEQFTGARRFDPPAPAPSDARVMPALKLPDDG